MPGILSLQDSMPGYHVPSSENSQTDSLTSLVQTPIPLYAIAQTPAGTAEDCVQSEQLVPLPRNVPDTSWQTSRVKAPQQAPDEARQQAPTATGSHGLLRQLAPGLNDTSTTPVPDQLAPHAAASIGPTQVQPDESSIQHAPVTTHGTSSHLPRMDHVVLRNAPLLLSNSQLSRERSVQNSIGGPDGDI